MVSEKKIRLAKEIEDKVNKYRSIILFDLEGIPSSQLHKIRELLRGEGEIKVVKKRIAKMILEKKNISLNLDAVNSPALLFSNLSVFDIIKRLRLYRLPMKAKVGSKAPKDIILKKGVTPVPAGPALATFKTFKIPTIIQEGKIAIKEDFVLCKEGEEIDEAKASLLNMLGVEPLEIGIEARYAYSEGLIYDESSLNITPEWIEEKIREIREYSLNLATNLEIPVKENISLFLTNAISKAKNLGIYLGIPSKDTINDLLAKAYTTAKKLEEKVNPQTQ